MRRGVLLAWACTIAMWAQAEASPRVIFIGDSITANWSNLTKLVPDSVNAGVGGETSSHDPKFFYGPLNDVRTPNVDSIAAMAEVAAAAGIRVLIASISDTSMPQHYVSAADVASFNAQLVALCRAYGYTYVDYQAMLQLPGGQQNQGLFLTDHIHPNSLGYERMFPLLAVALAGDSTALRTYQD